MRRQIYISTLFVLFMFLNVISSLGQPFQEFQDLSKSHYGIKDYEVIDFDDDSVKDIIAFSFYDYKVSWYKGLDSLGYSSQRVLIQNAFNVQNVIYNEFTSDSLCDILMNDLDSIYIYSNLGNGNLGERRALSTAYGYRILREGDLDGDGDLDLIGVRNVSLGSAEQVYYLENIGDTLFDTPLHLAYNSISRQVEIVDLDNDGDLDVIVAGRKLQWYENLGSGTLATPIDINIVSYGYSHSNIEIEDMDDDGDLDIIASSNHPSHRFKLFKNDGNTNFNSIIHLGTWISYDIDDITTYDVDEDGQLDIIFTYTGEVLWKRQIDSNTYDNYQDFNSVDALNSEIMDINSDGVDELIYHTWLGLYIKHIAYDTSVDSVDIEAVWESKYNEETIFGLDYQDVDGDGLRDLIGLDRQVFWRKNLGNHTFGDVIMIDNSWYQRPSAAADMDNDGDLDFVVSRAVNTPIQLSVRENINNTDSTIIHTIDPSGIYPEKDIEIGDIDGDGLLDIVVFSGIWSPPYDTELIWYKNLGNFTFSSKNVITTNLIDAVDIALCDLDSDGDLDVLSSSQDDGLLAWYKNLGNGTIYPGQNHISTIAVWCSHIECADFDNDGDIDIISRLGTTINYLKNNGNQAFSNSSLVSAHRTADYRAGDVNGDGFLDIVVLETEPEDVYWLENLSGTGFSAPKRLFLSGHYFEAYHNGPGGVFFEDDGNDGDMDVFVGLSITNRFSFYDNLRNTHSEFDTLVCDSLIVPSLTDTLFSSQTYIDTLVNSTGGDSILTIHLTVKEESYEVIDEHICYGDSFYYQSTYYQSSIQIIDSFQNTCFQDSIIEFNLWVHNDVQTIDTTLCEGESIQVGDSIYMASGMYVDTLQNIYQCDSIIHLNLTINPVSTVEIDTVSCLSFSIGSSVYNTSGLYLDTLVNSFGCDSIVLLDLTIAEDYEFTLDSTICDGSGVNIGTSYYKYEGSYTDTLNSVYGCDSVIHLNLEVIESDSIVIDTTICFGDYIVVGDTTYTTSGNYIDSLLNQCELDSVVYLNLTVNPTDSLQIDTAFCGGEEIVIGNTSYDQTGDYTIHLTNQYNCDSIIYLNLEVHNNQIVELDTFLCKDDELVIGSSIYTTPGTYFDTFTDVNGCDSTVMSVVSMTDLTVSVIDGALVSNQPNAQYQWLSCPDLEPITGATSPKYNPEYNGSYAVQISYNGCVDTTDCADIYNVGTEEWIELNLGYTNPFNHSIELNIPNNDIVNQLELYNAQGKLMFFKKGNMKANQVISTEDFSSGVYYLTIHAQTRIKTLKLIKL